MSTEKEITPCTQCGRSCACKPSMPQIGNQNVDIKEEDGRTGHTHTHTHHTHHHHHHQHQNKMNTKMNDEEDICVVCKKQKATMRFNPCRHRNSCANCAAKLKNCPKCNEFIMYRQIQLRA